MEAVTADRLLRPLRNLGLGLVVLLLFPFIALASVVMVVATTVAFMVFLVPVGCAILVAALAAVLLWLPLAVPSLIIHGDFTWPCQAARWILTPVDRLVDLTEEPMEWWFDGPMELMGWAWDSYGDLASRVEGC